MLLETSEKEKKTPYQKKKIKERRLFNNYIKFSFYLLQPNELNITDLMIMALKWDTTFAYIHSDHNKSIVQLFKRKKSILLALDALENISERLLDKMVDIQKQEFFKHKQNQNDYIDSLILILLRVNKKDIKNIRKYVENFVYDDEVKATALWNFCNETWEVALKTQRTWLEPMSSNTSIQKMKNYRFTKPEEWLIRNIHPTLFDEDKYRENERYNELTQRTFFSVAKIASGSYKPWQKKSYNYNQNYNNNHNNYNNYQNNNYQKEDYKQHTRSSSAPPRREEKKNYPKKTTRDKMFDYMNQQLKGEGWKQKYCGFHHYPHTTCKRAEKCKRSHKCPRCDGDHTLDKCDKKM